MLFSGAFKQRFIVYGDAEQRVAALIVTPRTIAYSKIDVSCCKQGNLPNIFTPIFSFDNAFIATILFGNFKLYTHLKVIFSNFRDFVILDTI